MVRLNFFSFSVLCIQQDTGPLFPTQAISPGVVETDLYVSLFQGDAEKAHAFLSERKVMHDCGGK